VAWAGQELLIDTWLMSCRVLGRQVEAAALEVLAAEARRRGATRLIGEYRPTPRNGLVAGHYAKLGSKAMVGSRQSRRRPIVVATPLHPEWKRRYDPQAKVRANFESAILASLDDTRGEYWDEDLVTDGVSGASSLLHHSPGHDHHALCTVFAALDLAIMESG
jgi:hypothetical protein